MRVSHRRLEPRFRSPQPSLLFSSPLLHSSHPRSFEQPAANGQHTTSEAKPATYEAHSTSPLPSLSPSALAVPAFHSNEARVEICSPLVFLFLSSLLFLLVRHRTDDDRAANCASWLGVPSFDTSLLEYSLDRSGSRLVVASERRDTRFPLSTVLSSLLALQLSTLLLRIHRRSLFVLLLLFHRAVCPLSELLPSSIPRLLTFPLHSFPLVPLPSSLPPRERCLPLRCPARC